jgi:hypothetical protein
VTRFLPATVEEAGVSGPAGGFAGGPWRGWGGLAGRDSLDQTGQQLANLRRLGQTLDCVPTAAIADGLSNRDRDWLLYGE